jgi:hypothetical protein
MWSCLMNCSQVGRIQVTAFQSQGGQHHTVTPLAIAPVIDLESSWSSSDNALASHSIEGIEHDTGDSRFSKSNKVWLDTTHLYRVYFVATTCSVLGDLSKTPFILVRSVTMYHFSMPACLEFGRHPNEKCFWTTGAPVAETLTRVHMCYCNVFF